VDLVVGGAGFIGSHLAARLVRENRPVRIFDNLSSGSRANLAGITDAIEVIEGDVRDPEAVRQATDGCEIVYHQAAEVSVQRSIADPRTTYDVNVGGTLNVLLAARDAGCRRVVVASSSAVYGDEPGSPRWERQLPAPASPYASSKVACEHLCVVFSRVYGLETVALRYFNVYGPRQDPGSPYAAVIPRFMRALSRRERPTIFGDGEQTRDFIYVDDVVEANLRAASVPEATGRVVNVGSGRSVSINELLALLADRFSVDVPPIYLPARPGDVRHSVAAVDTARAVLGLSHPVSLEEGLDRTITALRGGTHPR
jgi:UDP-glucose 4-epimerase